MEPISLETFRNIKEIKFWRSGTWLWCKGPKAAFTEDVRAKLRERGFRFSSGKQAWYKRPAGSSYRRGSKSLPQIREEYGAENLPPASIRKIFLNDKP